MIGPMARANGHARKNRLLLANGWGLLPSLCAIRKLDVGLDSQIRAGHGGPDCHNGPSSRIKSVLADAGL